MYRGLFTFFGLCYNVAMGKKNKTKTESQETQKEEEKLKLNIGGEAKRSAAAVFLFALALVIILGFLDQAGVVGRYLNKITGLVLGWARLVFPIFLVIAGIILLLRKEVSFYLTKIIGLGITLLAIAGIFHWFYVPDEMKKMAEEGSGGGYVGYFLAFIGEKSLGSAGSIIIMSAMFLIGAIVAFNFSLVDPWIKIREKIKSIKQKEEKENEAIPEEGENPGTSENNLEETMTEEFADPKHNISKIEFVAGPDQYVSSSLSESDQDKYIGPLKTDKQNQNREDGWKRKSKKNKWTFPPLDLLEQSTGEAKGGDVERNASIIEKTLRNFGIEVERGEIKTGPSVTQYSFRPAVGIKISKILGLQNDLALALAAHPIRIEAPIPGKSLIGIEVPNKASTLVRLREILESREFRSRKSNLNLALGQDVSGNFIFSDLAKMPHLLIAGATGTGKSVCINSVITTLLYQNSPSELHFIMVDPKRVELSLYNGIAHLRTSVVVENGKVVNALKWAVGEMERRYRLLQDVGARDIISYKEKIKEGKKKRYADPETGEAKEEDLENLPYIIIIIDELADLMGSHGKEVEGAIVRIAQMARAVGIHLIISTQRPSVEVITGLIKANITTRIAFQVATQIDSRTILDMGGAEKLLGNGDLLFLSSSSPKPKRIQGVFVSESEVNRVVKYIKNQQPEIENELVIAENQGREKQEEIQEYKGMDGGADEDSLVEAAKLEVVRAKKASASLLQRRLRVGYARAARLLDILEEKGIVGPADGAKPREVYAASGVEENTMPAYENPAEDQEKRDKWQI